MDIVLQLLAAGALIALMMGLRMASSRAIFRFRLSQGFRAHECDGTCSRHGHEEADRAQDQN